MVPSRLTVMQLHTRLFARNKLVIKLPSRTAASLHCKVGLGQSCLPARWPTWNKLLTQTRCLHALQHRAQAFLPGGALAAQEKIAFVEACCVSLELELEHSCRVALWLFLSKPYTRTPAVVFFTA